MDTIGAMVEENDLGFLASLSLFTGLPPWDLRSLYKLCYRRRHPAGSTILRQGELGAELYMIRSGEVAVRLRGDESDEIELCRLGEGALFGEMALFDSYPRSATVVAVGDVVSYSLSQAAFADFADENPAVLWQVCRVLCHRLRDTNSMLTKR
jgi:CRP-like cAMP-binding protein